MTSYEVVVAVNLPVEAEDDFPLPFDEVYRLHAADVFRFCLAQTRSRDAAEEATAEVFAAAYTAYLRVRPDAHGVKFWLLRIARNTVVSRWRRTARRARIDRLLSAAPAFHGDVHAAAEVRADLRAVVAALSRLRSRDRVLIGLRAAQLSYAEVGEFLGISEGAARVASHRALRALRAHLEDV
jgi:RNA polymerase sigma-70 factor (ECF subfamily)